MKELKVKIVEVGEELHQPPGKDYIRLIIEIGGRKLAIWTTETNLNALKFDSNNSK